MRSRTGAHIRPQLTEPVEYDPRPRPQSKEVEKILTWRRVVKPKLLAALRAIELVGVPGRGGNYKIPKADIEVIENQLLDAVQKAIADLRGGVPDPFGPLPLDD